MITKISIISSVGIHVYLKQTKQLNTTFDENSQASR